MPATAEQLFLEALSLPLEARADLTDRLVASSAEAIPPEIERAHLDEVHRRMARVAAGEVHLIPGEQVWRRGAHCWPTSLREKAEVRRQKAEEENFGDGFFDC